jgi:carbonic anhydrase/acetyltransferase-like protein (isoleucine patch superfamily)
MPKRSKGLRDKIASVSQNKLIRARVIEVMGNTVSVQLSQNASKLYGIRLIGGPVSVGDIVHIDYISSTPIAQAIGGSYTSTTPPPRYSPPTTDKNDVTPPSQNPSQALNSITLYDVSENRIYEYSANIDGSDLAVAAAADGDIIHAPACTIDGDVSIPAGVAFVGTSRQQTVINGQVTLGDGASFEWCAIERTANDAITLKGIVVGAGDQGVVINCAILLDQQGSGDVRGISSEANGADVQVRNSYIQPAAASGTANGLWVNTGTSAKIGARFVYVKGATPLNTNTNIVTYACQFDEYYAIMGTAGRGDRAPYHHYHSSGSDGGSIFIPLELDDLSDVDLTSPQEDDVLSYISGEWVNTVVAEDFINNLDNIGDVNVPSPIDGDALLWNQGTTTWTSGSVGAGGDGVGLKYRFVLYDESLEEVTVFNPTYAGLTGALAAADAGDAILYPNVTIVGNITLQDGVHLIGQSRELSILDGQITIGDEAGIENMSVITSGSSSGTLKGIVSVASKTFYIYDCDIVITQNGAGEAYAISCEHDSSYIYVYNSLLSGKAASSGDGYAVYKDPMTSATCYIFGGRAIGESTPFSE